MASPNTDIIINLNGTDLGQHISTVSTIINNEQLSYGEAVTLATSAKEGLVNLASKSVFHLIFWILPEFFRLCSLFKKKLAQNDTFMYDIRLIDMVYVIGIMIQIHIYRYIKMASCMWVQRWQRTQRKTHPSLEI